MDSLIGKLSEEEARELSTYIKVFIDEEERTIEDRDAYVNWKEKGYIKENPVEKAKKFLDVALERYNYSVNWTKIKYNDIAMLADAIEYLENQVKELKK